MTTETTTTGGTAFDAPEPPFTITMRTRYPGFTRDTIETLTGRVAGHWMDDPVERTAGESRVIWEHEQGGDEAEWKDGPCACGRAYRTVYTPLLVPDGSPWPNGWQIEFPNEWRARDHFLAETRRIFQRLGL